jgi:dockerin type I repeat protein
MGVLGATLSAGGDVDVFGSGSGPSEWAIASDGRLISDTGIDQPNAGTPTNLVAVSPNGTWRVSEIPQQTADGYPRLIRWHAGEVTYDAVPLPTGATFGQFALGVSDTGTVVFQSGDYYTWNPTSGLLPLQSLYQVEGDTTTSGKVVYFGAVSPSGVVVGSSGDDTHPRRATVWVDGIPHELPSGGYAAASATSVSDDGRVIGGLLTNAAETVIQPVVWVDGVVHVLTISSGSFAAYGNALAVVHGVGSDPNAWAAIGGSYYDLWLARSDGTVYPLNGYLPAHFGLALEGDNQPIRLLADENALYIVTFEQTVPAVTNVYPNLSTSDIRMFGHVLVLPNNYQFDAEAQLDLNGDHAISPADLVTVITALNSIQGNSLLQRPDLRLSIPNIDVNGDGELSPADLVQIVYHLNAFGAAEIKAAAFDLAPSDVLGLLAADAALQSTKPKQ